MRFEQREITIKARGKCTNCYQMQPEQGELTLRARDLIAISGYE